MKLLKFLWIPVVTVIILVLVLNGYIYFNQDNLIFGKEKINPKKVRPYGSHFEDVYLDMDDGSNFKCWFIKAKDHENKPVFLYYLGKGGYIEKYVKLFDMIVQRVDVSIFSCSNRGCGTNEGNPSEEQLYKDAMVPFNYLKQKNTKQLFIFGNSMGGAVALETASKHQEDIHGLILENPFLSLKKISEETNPFLNFFLLSFDMLIRTKMDNIEKIKKIHIPLLVNISEMDELVPPEHSKILFELCPSKHKFKYFSKKGTHNNIIKVDDGSYHASLKKFVQTAINVHEGIAEPQVPPPPAAA
ncbi:Uncharacterized protein PCOAH_00011190 [Plasmodium coatneyi]|uniref:Serine aminopeptidase S33 domain-containing protein n=1 Tax=Plasmodium coatneyi TaxID=208452 RepID=A0A1B1DVN0_9APIC|nr:Uncharacterized protein PCOAH_00011190 [Plasmodium coatneyi]ANQ06846.1 Uncharacterized protein PCOAH_00011190 [Plasmodium coatneyi]